MRDGSQECTYLACKSTCAFRAGRSARSRALSDEWWRFLCSMLLFVFITPFRKTLACVHQKERIEFKNARTIVQKASRLMIGLLLRLLVLELQRNWVGTVSFVSGSWEAFSLEDVTQMTTTVCTSDFDPLHSESEVRMPVDGSRNGCFERRSEI